MRRLLAAILSSAVALQPIAAANATSYMRFQPSDPSSASTATTGNDTTSAAAAGLTGPAPLYAHAYSFTDVTYALASGKAATFSASGLPSGLAMAADGTLSGTPTAEASGTALVTALLADGSSQSLAVPYEIHGLFEANYTAGADGFYTKAGHVNVALAIAAPALTGGPVLPVTWALTQGTGLPAGVALNADGTVTGTPTAFGDYNFSVVATDASGATAVTQSFDLSVADGIHVAALPDVSGHVGYPLVSETGSATGTIAGALTWGVLPGALPAGMSLNTSSGTVSGTPTVAAATKSYKLSAVDSTGIVAYSPAFNVTSYGALGIAAVPAMSMHVGQSFTSSAFAPLNSPVSPWTWRLTPGTALPSALGVDANAGDVYGTGSATGASTATVDVVDAQGDTATSGPFAVTVVAPLALAAVADRSVPSGGSATVTPALTGTPVGTLRWDLTGYGYGITTSQDATTGAVTFSSILGSKGSYRITASDDSGTYGDAAHASVSQTFAVSFEAPFTASAPSADTYAGTYRRAGTNVAGDTVTLASATVAANPAAPGGGAMPASVTWSVVDGTLPSGLALGKASGVVSGTLKADAQSAILTLAATDPTGVRVAASPRVSLTVLAPLDFVPATVSAHVGQALDATATTPTVTGGAAIGTLTWSLLSGTLPAGMSVDPATGAIVGTPTSTAGVTGDADPDGTARAFGRLAALLSPVSSAHAETSGAQTTTVTVQAKDSKGQAGTGTVTRTVKVVVAPALAVATPADVSVRIGDALNTTAPTLANAVGSPTWSLAKSSAALPSWLSLDTGKGTLSVNTYPYTAIAAWSGLVVLHVADGAGGAGVDTPAFKLTVKPALRIVGVGPTVSASFGQAFSSSTPTIQNGPVGTVNWKLSSVAPNGGALTVPSWIVADPATGVVSGTYPGTAADATNGSYVVSQLYLTATDGAGEPATMASPFSLVVGTNLVLSASPSVYVRQGDTLDVAGPAVTAGSATPTAPYTFSMASGNLAKGLQVTKGTGEIGGRPSATDNSASGSLQVVDSAGHFGLGNAFPITVLAPLAVDVQPPALTTFVGGPIATAAPQVTSSNPVAPVTWTFGSGSLPPGAKLAADGSLSGTATTASPAGSPYTATLNGADASANRDPVVGGASLSVTVQAAMTLPAQPALSFRIATYQSSTVAAAQNPLGDATYSVKGTLPGSLAMDAHGNVSGTPTAAGAATVTLTAMDSASTIAPTAPNQSASRPLTVNVLGALTLTPPTIPTVVAHAGSPVSIALPAVGNSPVAPAPGWAATPGSASPPAPLALTSGVLTSGTATLPASLAGDYPLAFTYTDAAGATAQVAFTLSVRGPLSIDPVGAIADVTMNVANAIAPPAVHGNPGNPAWSLLSGALPRGMSVRAADGYLVGPALQSGGFSATIGFTDSSGAPLSTAAFGFKVTPLSIPALAEVDVAMNSGTPVATPTLNGNPLPAVAWTVGSGTLPRGLKANADGSVTGTATQSGTFPLTLLATDANGETASVSFTLKVPALAIAQADQTEPLNAKFTLAAPSVSNGPKAPLAWTETGALPAGVTSAAGALSGTPTAPGTYPVSLSVKDADGETATTGTFDLVVPTPVLTGTDPTTVALNTQATVPAPTAAPGSAAPTVAWKLAGTLPKGTMVFSTSTGAITGKATYPGTYPLTVSATDGNGVALTPATFKLVVPAPVVASVADVSLQMNTTPAAPAPAVTGDPGVALTWSLALGTLPPGLSVNADGTLGGVATAPGTQAVQLSFSDPNGVTGSTNVFNVTVPALALAANVAEQDMALNASATVAAPSISGTPTTAQTWTLASGTLPSGLTLAKATGVISGTPIRSGTFPVSLRLVDANGQAVTTNVFKVVVAPLSVASAPTVQVTRTGLATAPSALTLHQGDAGYAFPVPAITGTPALPVTWSAASGSLPPGLAYAASTGTIGGAPTASGVYTLALLAKDANGETATSPPFTLTVLPPLVFGTVSNITLSTAYSRSVGSPSVAGSPQQPYLWQVASGTLPAKTALAPASGAISGQPDSTGAYPITLSLTDATGDAVTTPSFTLNVNGVLAVTAPATASVHAGAPSGPVLGTAAIPKFGVPPYTYVKASGSPPPGLTVDPATGLLTGTTAAQATYPAKYTFAESVTDSGVDSTGASRAATATTATYEVDVLNPLAVTTPVNASIHAGAVANATPTVGYGTGAVSWAITAPSSIPAGMAVSSTGVVSTTAVTPAGTYGVTLTVTDSTGAYATTGSFNVNVYGAVAMTGPASILMRYGTAYAGSKAFAFAATNGIAKSDGTGGSVFAAGANAPAGMSFSATGTWSGTPTGSTAVGTAAAPGSLVVTVSDSSSTSTTTGAATLTVPFAYYGTALGITAADGGTYPTNVPVSIAAPTVTGTPVTPVYTLSAPLPAGLALNADGSISGTATQATSVVETMTVTDATGGTATTASFTLATQAATLASATYPTSIANSSNTSPAVAAMYDASAATTTVMAAGGTLTYTFPNPVTANGMASTAASTATSGLVLSYNSGTSSAPVWTKASGAANPTSTTFQVTNTGTAAITLPDLFLSYAGAIPAYLPSTTAGTAYAGTGLVSTVSLDTPMATLNATGSETWTSTSLPTGFTLATSGPTLTIAKTVTAGSYTIPLSVTDSRKLPSVANNLVVTVTTPPTLTSASPSAIAQGAAYSAVLNTALSGANISTGATWAISGAPTGFAVSGTGTGATLTAAAGNAAAAGSYPVTVTSTNTGGNGLVASATLTLTVDAAPTLAAGTVTALYAQAFSGNVPSLLGGANIVPGATWTVSGSQPTGFALSGTDTAATYAAASGNAGALGTYALTFKVTNPDGLAASAVLTLTDTGTPVMASAKAVSTNYGIAFSKGLVSLMGATTVHPGATWTIAAQSGSLPTGYAVSGVGTAALLTNGSTLTAAAGTYPVTVTVTNPGAYAATGTLTLTVVSDPCYATTAPAVGTACFDGTTYLGLTPDGNKRMVLSAQSMSNGTSYNIANNYINFGNSDVDSGQSNTAALVSALKSGYAANYCAGLTEGGHTDWYLPSTNEMQVLGNAWTSGAVPSPRPTGRWWTSTASTSSSGCSGGTCYEVIYTPSSNTFGTGSKSLYSGGGYPACTRKIN